MVTISRKQTLVQLSDDLLSALDARAARDGKSRSAVIREAVEQHVHDEIQAEISRQIVEAYRRTPQSDEDADFYDSLAADAARALDEEEGKDGW